MNSARISCISQFLKQVKTIICLTTFKHPIAFHKLKKSRNRMKKKTIRCLNENITTDSKLKWTLPEYLTFQNLLNE